MAAQLELHGEDWRPRRLEECKARLAKLLARTPAGIQYTEHLEGDGAATSPTHASSGPRAP
jgi:hypothetical protein